VRKLKRKPLECNTGKIDLHIHSTASDGSLKPGEILDLAVKNDLKAISITDHDTVAGVEEALGLGIPDSLEFISGIEISAAFPPPFGNAGSLHILGYGIATNHPDLNSTLKQQQSARSDRNPLIIKKLNKLGIPASLDAICNFSGKDEVARPHIAEFLVRTGYAKDIDDAFDRLLSRGKPAYVDKYRIPAETAIALIKAAGGIAVLAHPILLTQSRPDGYEGDFFNELLETLITYGLGGIEAYYPGHTTEQASRFQKLAGKKGLLVTGGTDFHGSINPEIKMSIGRGDLCLPYDIFSRLKKALNHETTVNP
jgi:3',5'-nucleoside bisphosphate phosphatase